MERSLKQGKEIQSQVIGLLYLDVKGFEDMVQTHGLCAQNIAIAWFIVTLSSIKPEYLTNLMFYNGKIYYLMF